MTMEEIRKALQTGEEIEYHCTGVELGANLLPGPGWYACLIDEIYKNGNVEISFTNPDLYGLGVTVLKKNLAIAFRTIGSVRL